MKTKGTRAQSINVITLGCSKNWVDSENMITQLQANDYEVTHERDESKAEIVIINTCGFIDRAKEESVQTILEYAQQKSEGYIDKLYVTGCLSQRYKDNLEEEIPEVDAFFGTMELPSLLHRLQADYRHDLIGERVLTTPSHYAYLKISEGCNRTCSFCAIPLMRGKHISQPVEVLVKEARHLASQGVKELILIAQELTYYGLDLYKSRSLPRLLDALAGVEGIEWIRLHYAYPNKFPLEIIESMKSHPTICNYLDMPLQHISDPVLERMHRQISRQETTDLIKRIRDMHPDIHLRTTMLVGFPGETDADFDELCRFVEETRFNRLGVFQYSHEEGTTAYALTDDVAPETKEERMGQLMAIQQQISAEINEQKVGQRLNVLIDRKEGEYFVGRTEADSPEVDNEVLIEAANNYLRIGDFAEVDIIDANEYDLFATPSRL
ncbi:MAG: 30S ribosomal protein S12 methylthiotransferase RimO [Saprospiraceae bacterium]